jgi:hypothetical protein
LITGSNFVLLVIYVEPSRSVHKLPRSAADPVDSTRSARFHSPSKEVWVSPPFTIFPPPIDQGRKHCIQFATKVVLFIRTVFRGLPKDMFSVARYLSGTGAVRDLSCAKLEALRSFCAEDPCETVQDSIREEIVRGIKFRKRLTCEALVGRGHVGPAGDSWVARGDRWFGFWQANSCLIFRIACARQATDYLLSGSAKHTPSLS